MACTLNTWRHDSEMCLAEVKEISRAVSRAKRKEEKKQMMWKRCIHLVKIDSVVQDRNVVSELW